MPRNAAAGRLCDKLIAQAIGTVCLTFAYVFEPLLFYWGPMYRDFHALDRWTKKQVHCIYQALIVAVATRHADAVDIKFLVDGRPVWVALPLPAWNEYQKRTGKMITDPLAIAIAGRFLKHALESGEGVGREMYSLTVPQTLEHLDAVVNEPQPATV